MWQTVLYMKKQRGISVYVNDSVTEYFCEVCAQFNVV